MYQAFQLYSTDEAAALLEEVKRFEYTDGKATAGNVAARRKNNRQAVGNQLNPLRSRFVQRLLRHRGVTSYGQPRRFSLPMVNLAGPGEEYGPHTDAARMIGFDGFPVRTDLSYTLFLSPAESYDGGSLRFELGGRSVRVRLEAGQLILYPSTLVHSVEPVSRGERYCIVGWIESFVHDHEARMLLHRYDRQVQQFMQTHPDELDWAEESLAIYQGLLRQFAS